MVTRKIFSSGYIYNQSWFIVGRGLTIEDARKNLEEAFVKKDYDKDVVYGMAKEEMWHIEEKTKEGFDATGVWGRV